MFLAVSARQDAPWGVAWEGIVDGDKSSVLICKQVKEEEEQEEDEEEGKGRKREREREACPCVGALEAPVPWRQAQLNSGSFWKKALVTTHWITHDK